MPPIPQSSSSDSAISPPKKHVSELPLDEQRKYFLEMQEKRLKFVMDHIGKVKGVNKRGCTKLGTPPPRVYLGPRRLLTDEQRHEFLVKEGVIFNAALPPPPPYHRPNVNIHLKYLDQVRNMEVFNDDKIIDLPEKNFKNNPDEYENIKKCAALAIGDYNSNEHTNYRFVDIEKVHWELISGIRYYIIFCSKKVLVIDSFNPLDSYIWFELYGSPSDRDVDLLGSVIQAWYVMGRLGAYNSSNLQLANLSMEYDPLYDADKGFNVMPSSFHDISDVEFQDNWGRVWVDLGTSDILSIDVLLNCLTVLSSGYLGIQQVVFGGRRMGDWEEGMTSPEDGYKYFKI